MRNGQVVKLANTQASGACAARLEGSSPSLPTRKVQILPRSK